MYRIRSCRLPLASAVAIGSGWLHEDRRLNRLVGRRLDVDDVLGGIVRALT